MSPIAHPCLASCTSWDVKHKGAIHESDSNGQSHGRRKRKLAELKKSQSVEVQALLETQLVPTANVHSNRLRLYETMWTVTHCYPTMRDQLLIVVLEPVWVIPLMIEYRKSIGIESSNKFALSPCAIAGRDTNSWPFAGSLASISHLLHPSTNSTVGW